MNDTQKKIFNLVIEIYRNNGGMPLDEEKINSSVNYFLAAPFWEGQSLTDDEKKELIKEIKRYVEVNVDRHKNTCLLEKNHKPWYREAKAQNEKNLYWNRYNDYLFLDKHYNKPVIDSIDIATDDIMDLLGNPLLSNDIGFVRKGLILGDVQSGKTGTYIGLINKAADVKYKVIILLTGVIEKLRQQTQSRIDEGFIGSDSSALVKGLKAVSPIGVGKYLSNNQVVTTCLTSTENDFNAKIANNVVSNLQAINGPIILVVKKNKSVLTKLHQWFCTRNNLKAGSKLNYPLLLIDDEADNASVNTNKEETNPTIINKCIRDLLDLFTKSNYVGFTATPYANIFIKPDSDEEMECSDLFPRDFIYVLKKPSNYIGPEEIFFEDGKCSYMLKSINDEQEQRFLPEKHKKDFKVGSELPEDLKEAICSFFIANAIRDLRNHKNTHRSMLINISRFVDVQNQIATVVDSFVRTYQRVIENYSLSAFPLEHPEIAYMKKVYEKHFALLGDDILDGEKMFSWDEILHVLYRAVAPIVVRAVNKDNAQKNLSYSDYVDTGLRVIAEGGFSLSRGLTLEGLCTSYYYRNSKMYDTLMQMGRWFGYRDQYADLCQIWMNETSRNWYQEITRATKELKDDLCRMDNQKKTPKDFGLWVRSDITALYVTAKNKMRNAEIVSRKIKFSGKIIETPYLDKDLKRNEIIRNTTESFIDALLKLKGGFSSTQGLVRPSTPIFKDVPVHYIVKFLQNVKLSGEQVVIDKGDFLKYIVTSESYSKWDVAIATGDGNVFWTFAGRPIKNIQRSFRISDNSYVISGRSSRVGDTGMYGLGLAADLYDKLRTEKKKNEGKELAQADLFAPGVIRNPLLVIYPVELIYNSKTEKNRDDEYLERKKEIVHTSEGKPYIAIGMGFPCKDGETPIEMKYTMNLIKRKELLEADDEYLSYDAEEDIDE